MKMSYLVITAAGYWGKASTVKEACKQANVPAKGVHGNIHRLPEDVCEKFACSGHGGVSMQWSDKVFKPEWLEKDAKVPEDIEYLLKCLWQCAPVAEGLIKYSKQKDRVTVELT